MARGAARRGGRRERLDQGAAPRRAGRRCAPTTRAWSRAARAPACGARRSRSRRSSASCASRVTELVLEPDGAAAPGAARRRAAAARLRPLRRDPGARGHAAAGSTSALDGPARRWWRAAGCAGGAGARTRTAPPLPRAARGRSCAPSSALTPSARAARGARGGALPEPAPAGARLARALVAARRRRDTCATTARRACRTPPGESYPDLVRLRSGDGSGAPDAVVLPGIRRRGAPPSWPPAPTHGVAVVPFGGGTSVVGGVEPLRGRSRRGDLARPRAGSTALVDVDRDVADRHASSAGLSGPELERRLGAQGLTLGHFPQSFEFSTVGGWVATRSAGQASTGYGRIDELVEGLRCVAPAGELGLARRARPPPPGPCAARAAGGLRGRARRDHRGDAARAARARRRAATRAGRSVASRRASRRSGRWSRRTPRPTWRACPTRRRRGWRMAHGSAGGTRRAARAAPTCGCAATRAAAW